MFQDCNGCIIIQVFASKLKSFVQISHTGDSKMTFASRWRTAAPEKRRKNKRVGKYFSQ